MDHGQAVVTITGHVVSLARVSESKIARVTTRALSSVIFSTTMYVVALQCTTLDNTLSSTSAGRRDRGHDANRSHSAVLAAEGV